MGGGRRELERTAGVGLGAAGASARLAPFYGVGVGKMTREGFPEHGIDLPFFFPAAPPGPACSRARRPTVCLDRFGADSSSRAERRKYHRWGSVEPSIQPVESRNKTKGGSPTPTPARRV